MKINGKCLIACWVASGVIGTITANLLYDRHENGKTIIGYEKTDDSIENNYGFNPEEDIYFYGENGDFLFNLLLNIFKKRLNIRTDIKNQHTLYLNTLGNIIGHWGESDFLAVQYDDYLGLLDDYDSNGYADKLLMDGLTIDSFVHRIYSDDVLMDFESNNEISCVKSGNYFTNVIINPYFKSTRDASGEYYHVNFISLTKDKTAINFANDEDCYIPSDLEIKVTEDGIIYGEGIVTKKRCEELLSEFLRIYIRTFEPEKGKQLNFCKK